jgi:hypothetical protein
LRTHPTADFVETNPKVFMTAPSGERLHIARA